MNETRNCDRLEELRKASMSPRIARSKENEGKQRFVNPRHKEVFLTDNQTDQTKSSTEITAAELERLEYANRKLQKENHELKQTILKLKASEFYGINEEKVKKLIRQNETLCQQLKIMRKELEKILVEKDFLERNNRVLKEKYEELTRENNKPAIQSRMRTEWAQMNDYELVDDLEEFSKENRPPQKQKRSISNEKSKMTKKKSSITKPEQKWNPESRKLKEGGKLNEEYYISRQLRSSKKYSYQ